MTVEDLLEALRQLPLTAYVAVRARADEDGVSVERVTYARGQAVVYLEEDDDEESV